MFELIRIPGQGVQNIHKCNSRRLENMRASGIRVSAFHSRRGKGNRLQLNFRNHRKIVVADGHRAWVGGHNVGDEYMGIDPEFGHWRDTHIRLDGPAAVAAQLSFAEDWHWATDEILAEIDWNPGPAKSPGKSALVISSGPADRLETASLITHTRLTRPLKGCGSPARISFRTMRQ